MASKEQPIPGLLSDLFKACETECVAGCCGLEAFDCSRERIVAWLQSRPPEERTRIGEQFDGLLRGIADQAEEDVIMMPLNCWLPKAEAATFIEGLRKFGSDAP